jgi:hypothetical protein
MGQPPYQQRPSYSSPRPPFAPGASRPTELPWFASWWLWFTIGTAVLVVIAAAVYSGRGSSSGVPSLTAPGSTSSGGAKSSPAEATATSQATASPGVGATVRFREDIGNEGTVTLHGIRRIAEPEGPIGGPARNGSYLVADFTVALMSGSGSANPLRFRAQSPDGRTYDSELGVTDNQIDESEIGEGRQVRGEVAFDAPVGDLLLDYMEVLGGPLATFSVNG